MKRAVSSLLILLMLLGQCVFAVPHSHAESSIGEPDGHAARPHVHLHFGHCHDGHHDDCVSTGEQAPDHDSDAVYTGDDQFLPTAKVSEIAKAMPMGLIAIVDQSTAIRSFCQLGSRLNSPPMLRPKCARYLQLLSIRC